MKSVKIDFKLKKFIDELKNNKNLKDKKLILFSESKETCEDLFKNISNLVTKNVWIYTSKEAKVNDRSEKILNREQAREVIAQNFNPNIDDKVKKNDIEILISSDVLAEGVDL